MQTFVTMSSGKSQVLHLPQWLFRLSMLRRLSLMRVFILLLMPCLAFLLMFTSFYNNTVALFRRDSSLSFAPGAHNSPPESPVRSAEHRAAVRAAPPQKCVFPSLQLNDSLMMSFVKKPSPVDCPQRKDWVYLKNGTLVFSEEVRIKEGNFTCDFFPLVRPPSDDRVTWGPKIQNFPNGSQIVSDFFKVACSRSAPDRNASAVKPGQNQQPPKPPDYTEVFMGVSPFNKDVWSRLQEVRPPANGLGGLSVLMLGFDSMSRMSWLRRMPTTREFLVNKLGGIELQGYNIMGDGTPAALLPILTGKHESELPNALRNRAGGKPVDGHPWIWKDFAKVGYITCWADAMVNIAPFNYRMLGFRDPPTDYFARPYYLAIRDNQRDLQHKTGCRGPEPKHQVWFRWVQDIFHMYRHHPKFMMHFYAALSHDDNNRISLGDNDFKTFLQEMESHNYLNSTILIVFGDHGARYTHVRQTWAGRLEERLPYMSFRFPPWFERKYPDLMRNFRVNVHRLTTPMDIHETLRDVIKFDGAGMGDLRKRGISLFKEIPAERECKHADIRNHWCACLDWRIIQQPNLDLDAKKAAQAAVDFINGLTEPQRALCARLEIANITAGQRLQANDEFLHFDKAIDKPLNPNSKEKPREEVVLYQMTFMTKPGKGLFEVTVTHKGLTEWKISERDISRINIYGDAPSCILNINRQLRSFCYCNSLVEKS